MKEITAPINNAANNSRNPSRMVTVRISISSESPLKRQAAKPPHMPGQRPRDAKVPSNLPQLASERFPYSNVRDFGLTSRRVRWHVWPKRSAIDRGKTLRIARRER